MQRLATESTTEDVQVWIDELLETYRAVIGDQYITYRNHVHRVYQYCLLQDHPASADRRMIYAIAACFHDLGIWTAQTHDYLDPSKALATTYLRSSAYWPFTKAVLLAIEMHHKITPYTGDHALTTETFRQADRVDVSMGLLRTGISRQAIRDQVSRYPYRGFHRFLFTLIGRAFIRKPWRNPLPMFRR